MRITQLKGKKKKGWGDQFQINKMLNDEIEINQF
jgi:hypothetical protein